MGIGGELIGDVEQLLVNRTLRSKALFRMIGTKSQCWKAETEIEQMYPGMRCLLMPSATMSLAIVLELLDLKPGQEILISPFGWVANWSCIARAGLIPRFLPLDDQLQVDADAVKQRISKRTGAVIVTHMLGRGQQDIAKIAAVCKEQGIVLLEDIAQSFGVKVGEQRAGCFGDAAWCSLNHHKMLSTGDGGFVLVKDTAFFRRVCARQDQGNVLVNGKRRPADKLEPGLSLRSTELTASILRAQLARYHLLRARIKKLHVVVAKEISERLGLSLIPAYKGDIPFTVFFGLPPGAHYRSLADTGWHNAANVPWLAQGFHETVSKDPEVGATIETMRYTAAVGSGFVDSSNHGFQLGLNIKDTATDAANLVTQLQEVL